jgi:hypothetical protein
MGHEWSAFWWAALFGAGGCIVLEIAGWLRLRDRWLARHADEPEIPGVVGTRQYWFITIAGILAGAFVAGVHGLTQPLHPFAALNVGAFWPLAISAAKASRPRQDPGAVS